jgi:hypothetical protein
MEWDLQAADDAEVRLADRSRARREALARRDRRRRLLPWLLSPVVLPALGAAAMLAVLRDELRGSGEMAAAAGCLLVPAVVSWWLGRAHGRIDAVLWALVTAAVELALVVGVGFVALDLGP